MFSEALKIHRQDKVNVTPARMERIYRDKVLGVDCKTYFDHYYGRLRDYYDPRDERAVKRLLRELAEAGSLSREACFRCWRESTGGEPGEDSFNVIMTGLENDFYIAFDGDARRYSFACKLLRDWWLRHYGMAA